MKALSIRQPWAWLIVNGYKTIENRTWNTNFRGEFLIHTGKTFDYEGHRWVENNFVNTPMPPGTVERLTKTEIRNHFNTGGFVGIGELVATHNQSDDPFFTGPYGFELKNVRQIEFIDYPGSLKFFNVPDAVVNKVKLLTEH